MSDVNKIVAAVLAAGRMPTFKNDTGSSLPADDWLAEYQMWVKVLNDADASSEKAKASAWSAGMMDELSKQNEL